MALTLITAASSRKPKRAGVAHHRSAVLRVAIVALVTVSASRAAESPLAEFSVFGDGDALLGPVRVATEDRLFIFDTGASYSVFDSGLVRYLSRPTSLTEMSTPGAGQVTSQLYVPPDSAAISGIGFPAGTKIAALDLEWLRRVSGHRLEGAIGADFLRHFVVEIDMDHGKLSLLKSPRHTDEGAIGINWTEDRIPSIRAVIGRDTSADFVIDTGFVAHSASGSLCPATVSTLVKAGDAVKVKRTSYSQTAAGTTRERDYRVSSLSIGEVTIRNAIFSQGERDALGLRVFVRLAATFDFPDGKLYVKPGRRVDEADIPGTSGLHFCRVNGGAEMVSIDPDSSGALASIRPHDILLRVGDFPAATSRLYTLRVALETNREPLSLELRRGSRTYRTTLSPIDNGRK